MTDFPSKHQKNSEKSTGLLFMRTYNKWHGEIKKQLKSLGITHPQFVILTALGFLMQEQQEITQVMLAKITGMDVMSASQIINLLDKNKLLTRKEHSKDTRAKSVSITKKGEDILIKALPIVEAIDENFFGKLKADEKVFIDLLHKL